MLVNDQNNIDTRQENILSHIAICGMAAYNESIVYSPTI